VVRLCLARAAASASTVLEVVSRADAKRGEILHPLLRVQDDDEEQRQRLAVPRSGTAATKAMAESKEKPQAGAAEPGIDVMERVHSIVEGRAALRRNR